MSATLAAAAFLPLGLSASAWAAAQGPSEISNLNFTSLPPHHVRCYVIDKGPEHQPLHSPGHAFIHASSEYLSSTYYDPDSGIIRIHFPDGKLAVSYKGDSGFIGYEDDDVIIVHVQFRPSGASCTGESKWWQLVCVDTPQMAVFNTVLYTFYIPQMATELRPELGPGLTWTMTTTMDIAIIAAVITAVALVLVCLLFIMLRYLYRHKGTYHTNEAKGTEFAESADAALQSDPALQDANDNSRKEYFI